MRRSTGLVATLFDAAGLICLEFSSGQLFIKVNEIHTGALHESISPSAFDNPESDVDARACCLRLLWNAMLPTMLRGAVHEQQAPMGQLH